jgi:signal transduction histidine kinase
MTSWILREPVDVSRLIDECLDVIRPLADRRRISVEKRIAPDLDLGPAGAQCDPVRLKQVLYNYLSNAVKFTPEGGQVIIRAALDGSDRFRVEVEDTGIGTYRPKTSVCSLPNFISYSGSRTDRRKEPALGWRSPRE